MGKSKPLVAGGTEMPHTTIATDPGLARTGYELGGGSFGCRATLEPIGELTTDSVNDLILQSTIVCVEL